MLKEMIVVNCGDMYDTYNEREIERERERDR